MELMLIGGLLVLISAGMAALGFRGREQIVGIDLGTTFSVVALRSQDRVTVLPDRLSKKLLVPSVVTYHSNGTVTVGDRAAQLRNTHPNQTIFNAKRFIGLTMGQVKDDIDAHAFKVVANVSGAAGANLMELAAGFAIPRDNGTVHWVSPIDVGAEVVRHMKQSIATFIGYGIHRAVICVPAKFSPEQAKATRIAFEKAGFKVMRVLEEPTAAAIAYNLHKGEGVRYTLVYDLGGGTLDTSLLYMNGKSVSVLGVSGDSHLGGSDFDLQMLELLQSKLATSKRSKLTSPSSLERCDRNGLHIASERAKITLSDQPSATVRCLADDGTARTVVVTRDEFERACEDLFKRCIDPIHKVLADQKMTEADVDDVVLVGGGTRMPHVRDLLRDFFGSSQKLHTDIDPDVTIAYGAANVID